MITKEIAEKRFFGKGFYDYYIDMILDRMKDKNYSFYPLSRISYRIDFHSYSFIVEFSPMHKNVQVFFQRHGESLNYETMLIVPAKTIEEFCLGYKQMCIAHEVFEPIKNPIPAHVFSEKERAKVQKRIGQILYKMSQRKRQIMEEIFQ